MTLHERRKYLPNEAEMREAIVAACNLQGGTAFWVPRSDLAGPMEHYPDLTLILPRRGVVAFVELKSATRKVTTGQAAVIADLQACGRAEAWIVRAGEARDGELPYRRFMDWLESQEDQDAG